MADFELSRLMSRVVQASSGCWEWQGAKTGSGYGAQRFRGRLELTHRISYLLSTGPIDAGHQIDHLCRNTICCNPDHLEAVTPAENTRRQPRVAERTHCPAGHELVGQAAYIKPDGCIACRICRGSARDRYESQRGRDIGLRTRGECRYGHPYDEANTYVDKTGARNCRTCRREATRRYSERSKRGN